MDRTILFLACILAGFALIRVPLTGTLAALDPIVAIIGVISILVFSIVLIFYGVRSLISK
ncbi:hypothetical protein LC085_16065 [Bacillus tianshenii]|uniref:hypothetical protein n=1 Tax=Sutcliffiella tianshenii TaxID=1463404 RepID=UPI001CD7484A|nr:hypothetical protein [Bacillus tianshenii]MCA1321421.1 hypothetical protein [Bacillus tianshenii]